MEPRNAVIVGLRDVDAMEKPQVRDSGVRAFTMRHIDERGMRAVMDEAIRLACDGTAGFHLSLDMDFVDPAHAPGVGTPVRGGVTYREAHLAMEMICDSGKMVSMEVVEVNPVIDEVNRTADLAVELVDVGTRKANSMKLRVAVVYGGRSGEHEVSVRSARAIMDAMDREKYEVIEYFIDAQGKWAPGPILPEPGAHPDIDVVFPGPARHLRRGRYHAGPARTGRSALRGRGRARVRRLHG